RDGLSRRSYECRSAHERVGLRAEQVAAACDTLARRGDRLRAELAELEDGVARAGAEREAMAGGEQRVAELEAELEQIERERELELQGAVGDLERELHAQRSLVEQRLEQVAAGRAARADADAAAASARERVADAERAVEQ